MRQARVAKRYAQALMDLAEESNTLDRIATDLQLLQRIIRDVREFALFLKSPVIKKEKKRQILGEILGERVSKLTRSFVDLLTEKGREDILEQIIEQFFVLHDERMGVVPVEVRVATELAEDLKKRLQERLEQLTKKNVRMLLRIDREIRGGFVARVGDTVFDGSVKRQLELLREKFGEGALHT